MNNEFQILKESFISTNEKLPLISIIIPVFNREELIADALCSAISQNYPNLEIVVIDNASTDETLNTVINISKDDSRVKVVKNNKNVGPVMNWLIGVQLSSGVYTKILFSDDLLMKDCISKMYKLIGPNIGLVMSSCFVGETLQKSKRKYFFYGNNHFYNSKVLLARYVITRSFIVSPCAALFRKIDIEESLIHSLSEPVCEESIRTGAGPDVKIYFDTLQKYPYFAFTHKPYIFFRIHLGSFTIGKDKLIVNLGYKKTFDYLIKNSSNFTKIISKLFVLYKFFSSLKRIIKIM